MGSVKLEIVRNLVGKPVSVVSGYEVFDGDVQHRSFGICDAVFADIEIQGKYILSMPPISLLPPFMVRGDVDRPSQDHCIAKLNQLGWVKNLPYYVDQDALYTHSTKNAKSMELIEDSIVQQSASIDDSVAYIFKIHLVVRDLDDMLTLYV
nr:hypothetical protein [Tanacetum cinerariifolium]